MYPAYLRSYRSGKLAKITEEAFDLLESCSLCPRKCGINRLKGELGFCKTGLKPRVYSFMPHQGEEPPISGVLGSGTIFFSGCNMRCSYCQNYEFSQEGGGREVAEEELADIMLKLQGLGCHNINLVTPTHIMPQILKALFLAVPAGLKIPLVYNTSGYELGPVIKLLSGIIDVYLADMRYGDNLSALKYSEAPDYPKYNQEAIKQMYGQVGLAETDKEGIIRSGLIIRHLVLPFAISGTDKVMRFIKEGLSADTYISLMSQYLPCYKAADFQELARRITYEEYERARDIMQKYGLENGWIQDSMGLERFAGSNIKPYLK
ncbi:MAG: radical SAM protein [Candidatus Omnitrophica bacterium]|nr:radical SAM protein [Candidatus Omnitrophota bacterium]